MLDVFAVGCFVTALSPGLSDFQLLGYHVFGSTLALAGFGLAILGRFLHRAPKIQTVAVVASASALVYAAGAFLVALLL